MGVKRECLLPVIAGVVCRLARLVVRELETRVDDVVCLLHAIDIPFWGLCHMSEWPRSTVRWCG
jgi:hypothetical protein